MSEKLEKTNRVPVIEIATGMMMIMDIIDRIKAQTGHEITVANLADFVAMRKLHREALNLRLGVPTETLPWD